MLQHRNNSLTVYLQFLSLGLPCTLSYVVPLSWALPDLSGNPWE